jgi:hypothetical protein
MEPLKISPGTGKHGTTKVPPRPQTPTKTATKTNSTTTTLQLTKLRAFWKRCLRYRTLKIVQIALAFYVGFLTYADIGPPGGLRDQETGFIVDQASEERTARGVILVNGVERAIVATNFFQVVCIGITRMSAFFMYPGMSMFASLF